MSNGSTQNQPNGPTPEQMNAMQSSLIRAQAVRMCQPIFNKAIDPTQQLGPVTVEFRNVGFITGFKVVVSGTIQNTDGAVDAVATPFGVSNVLSGIKLTDLQNKERIDTNGLHVSVLNTTKGRWPFASALQAADWNSVTAPFSSMPAQYGDNFPVIQNLNSLTHGTSKKFRMVYDIPCAYSDDDLRGGLFASVINATGQLDLAINPNAFVATGQDDTLAVLRSGTCSFLNNVQITVYQNYLDQLPTDSHGKPILPIIDVSTAYLLNRITKKGIAAGDEFPVSYSNFRDFLSTFVIYNNSGGNDGHGVGDDINYWALQSANFTNIFKKFPLDVAQDSRDIIGTDLPKGSYYFSHRRKPISTLQYGNMQLVLNAITAGASAYLTMHYEQFAVTSVLTQAGSLQQ